VAVDEFKAARRAVDTRAVEPADYRQKSEARARLRDAVAANRAEAELLHGERTRLDRIRRTSPARLALARCEAARAAMGDVAQLPDDAEVLRQAAVLGGATAGVDLARERAAAADCAAALAALVLDEAVLGEAAAIDRLVADRNKILDARRDRETQRIRAATLQQNLQDMARQLGLPADAERLAARVPNTLARDAAGRAITEHLKLTTRAEQKSEQLDEARAGLAAALRGVEACPAAEDTAALTAAIDAAKGEARIETERAAATRARQAAEAELQRRLVALPLWSGGVEALAAAPLPLASMVAERAQGRDAREAERAARENALAEQNRVLRDLQQKRAKIVGSEALPTETAVAGVREQRDRQWQMIGASLRAGKVPPEPVEQADRFETLLVEADRLADRRASDAERVAAFEHLLAQEADVTLRRDAAAAELATAEQAWAAAREAWNEIWRPMGIVPEGPAAMADWLKQRAEVMAQHRMVGECGEKLADIAHRYETVWARLAEKLPDAATGNLAELRLAAEQKRDQELAREAALARARHRADEAADRVEAAEREMARIEQAELAWRDRWQNAACAIGLDPAAPPESGKAALELWNRVDLEIAAWREADTRIAEMTVAIEDFEAQAMRVAACIGDAGGADAHAVLRRLADRLDAARAMAKERQKILAMAEKLQRSIAALEKTHAEAEARLAALRLLAGAEDDAALQAAIRRAAEFAELTHQIGVRETELRGMDDGKSRAELEAEAVGEDLDTLPARIATIEARLREIAEENAAFTGQITDLDRELREMEAGHRAGDAAQAMQNALAEIDDISHRYVRLRLAHTLLRAGIDRFRREQQGPLLQRAGALFAELTEGRYHRLGVDQADDGKLLMVASRPDGTECPAERLSEGTRDQLYLSLRLAAIESFAVRSEPLPFIADDLLVNFDDRRARAALKVLARFGQITQTILFTHHAHIAGMAESSFASLHHLPVSAGVQFLDRAG
jgi:uncharacterized protein YhaN